MNNFLDTNRQYCLHVADDNMPVNDTVLRISCQSSHAKPTDTSRVLSICYFYSVHCPTPDSLQLSHL